MKLTLFAASGRTGRHVLTQALDAGHEVTAVVRNPAAVTAPVDVVRADFGAPDPEAVELAVTGSDAVISALGPRNRDEDGITSRGTRVIAEAMHRAGVRRLVVVSVAGISQIPTRGRPDPPKQDHGMGLFTRYVLSPLASAVLGKHYADVALMEDELRAGGLDWTSVQLPRLTDRPPTGEYRVAYGESVWRGRRIARADAAHFLLRALELPETIRRSVSIAY